MTANTPHRCPVCAGRGKILDGDGIPPEGRQCHACRGKGVLWSSEAAAVVAAGKPRRLDY